MDTPNQSLLTVFFMNLLHTLHCMYEDLSHLLKIKKIEGSFRRFRYDDILYQYLTIPAYDTSFWYRRSIIKNAYWKAKSPDHFYMRMGRAVLDFFKGDFNREFDETLDPAQHGLRLTPELYQYLTQSVLDQSLLMRACRRRSATSDTIIQPLLNSVRFNHRASVQWPNEDPNLPKQSVPFKEETYSQINIPVYKTFIDFQPAKELQSDSTSIQMSVKQILYRLATTMADQFDAAIIGTKPLVHETANGEIEETYVGILNDSQIVDFESKGMQSVGGFIWSDSNDIEQENVRNNQDSLLHWAVDSTKTALFHLPQAYRALSKWYLHPQTLNSLKKLVDSEGNFLIEHFSYYEAKPANTINTANTAKTVPSNVIPNPIPQQTVNATTTTTEDIEIAEVVAENKLLGRDIVYTQAMPAYDDNMSPNASSEEKTQQYFAILADLSRGYIVGGLPTTTPTTDIADIEHHLPFIQIQSKSPEVHPDVHPELPSSTYRLHHFRIGLSTLMPAAYKLIRHVAYRTEAETKELRQRKLEQEQKAAQLKLEREQQEQQNGQNNPNGQDQNNQ